jgi:hypothetical protein
MFNQRFAEILCLRELNEPTCSRCIFFAKGGSGQKPTGFHEGIEGIHIVIAPCSLQDTLTLRTGRPAQKLLNGIV